MATRTPFRNRPGSVTLAASSSAAAADWRRPPMMTTTTAASSSVSPSVVPVALMAASSQEGEQVDKDFQLEWDEPWIVAMRVQDQLRIVQHNLLLSRRADDDDGHHLTDGSHNNRNKNSRPRGIQEYVELLRSLQERQAVQVHALLQHLPSNKENVLDVGIGNGEQLVDDARRRRLSAKPSTSSVDLLHGRPSRKEDFADREEPRGEGELMEDEKKQEGVADRHDDDNKRRAVAMAGTVQEEDEVAVPTTAPTAHPSPNSVTTTAAAAAAPAFSSAADSERSDVSEWQHQQQQLLEQLQQPQPNESTVRFGNLRMETLEEVEYETDRTTPRTTDAISSSSTSATSIATTTPASQVRPTPKSSTTRSQGRRRRSLYTPGGTLRRTRTPVAPRSTPRSWSTTTTPYVEAPSDEMDSQMWELESNRTLDTFDNYDVDDDDDDTFEQLHGTDLELSLMAGRNSEAIDDDEAASCDQLEDDEADDDDDDEYDSALDCATIIASHREDHAPRSPDAAYEEVQGDALHEPSPAASAVVHATPSSAFRHKVVVVDYSDNQPSPTMTNITMDDDLFDAVGKVEETMEEVGVDVGAHRSEPVLAHDNESSAVARIDHFHKRFGREAHEDDNATTTSQETPVLERYRIDLDDESPHGFAVIPNPRRSRRGGAGDRSGSAQALVDAIKVISTARSPSQLRQTPTLLEKASTAFQSEDLGLSSTSPSIGGAHHATANDWLASPGLLPAGRHRSARKALRKSPYKLPKLVPTTPTIDENNPLDNVDVSSSSVDRNRHGTAFNALLDSASLRPASVGSIGGGPGTLPGERKEPVVRFRTDTSPATYSSSTVLFANAQLALRDAQHLNRCHKSFDYSDLRYAEAESPREATKNHAAPARVVVIPALTEEEYNSSRCIARVGITLDEAQRAIDALNRVLRDREAAAAVEAGPAPTTPSVGRSDSVLGGSGSGGSRSTILRSSPYLKNRRDAAAADKFAVASSSSSPPPRSYFGEHEAKRVLMQALDINERKSKTILVGLCHWRRLVVRRQSFGGSSGGTGGESRSTQRSPSGTKDDDNEDNASTSSSTTLSLLLYEVPATKPREILSLV